MSADGATTRRSRVFFALTWPFGLTWIVLWLAQVLPARVIADDALDPSWSVAMGRFLAQRLACGVDYVFTYGPLGYFSTNVYEPSLYWEKLVLWEIGWRLLASWFLVRALWRIPSRAERTLACVLVLLVPMVFDAFALAILVATTALLASGPRVGRVERAAGIFVLVSLALVKFTFAAAAGGCLCALVLAPWLREGGRSAWRAMLFDALTVLASGLCLWFAAGQGLANLAPWLKNSLAIASAYNEGESKPASALATTLGLATLAGLWLMLAFWTFARPRSRERVLLGVALALACFFSFKAGYVRGDDHTPYYLGFALCGGWLLPRAQQAWILALRLGVPALALVGIFTAPDAAESGASALLRDFALRLPANVHDVFAPGAAHEQLERARAASAQRFDLPKIRARVGREPVDVFNFHQGVALLNGLEYRPRPVFQSYVAFTEELQQLDVAFYESARAPRFVLFKLETIDDRLATMEQSLLLECFLRRYQPVLYEHHELLLERRAVARPPPQRTVELEREIGFGEELVLPTQKAEARTLALEIRTRPIGRLAQFLYRAPELQLELRNEFGAVRRARIVPGMMKSGVLIDPSIAGSDGWVSFLVGGRLPRAGSVRVVPPEGWEWMYEQHIGLRLERLEGLAPPRDDALARELSAFVFERMPDGLQSPRSVLRVDFAGHDCFFVYAPAVMIWELSAGKHTLDALFGLIEDPERRPCARKAWFRVGLHDGDEQRLVFERLVDLTKPEDRAALSLALEFETQHACQLVLATAPPEGDATKNAWCWWSGVKLDARK